MNNLKDRAYLLGALFYYGPTAEETQTIINAINTDASIETHLSIDMIAWQNALQQPDLALAWQNQFIGPQHLIAPPWGSVYLDQECIVFGESTLELRHFLQQCQLQLESNRNEPEDHFGLLLLAFVIFLQNEDLHHAKQLLTEHLLPWGLHYLKLLIQYSEHPFIKLLAQEAYTFLETCTHYYQLTIPYKKIYWQP